MEMNRIAEGSARESNVDEQALLNTMEAEAAQELTTNEDPQFGSKKLSEMSGPEMLELQHEMVETARDLGMDGSDCRPRKVWHNKADGVRTVLALHKRIEAHRAEHGGNGKAPAPVNPGLRRLRASKNADKIRESVVKDNKKALAAAKKERETLEKGTQRRRTPNAVINSKKINFLHKDQPNPKRGKSAQRFGCYRDGMTVAEYVEAVEGVGGTRSTALADLDWDAKHGWVKVAD